MYPNVSLINKYKNNLVVFERDLNNPLNEGFIIYWEIIECNKQLIFKKRLTTIKANDKLIKLREEGWIKKIKPIEEKKQSGVLKTVNDKISLINCETPVNSGPNTIRFSTPSL